MRELRLFVWSALVAMLVLLLAFSLGQAGPYFQAPGFVPPGMWQSARLGASAGVSMFLIGTAVNLVFLARKIWAELGAR